MIKYLGLPILEWKSNDHAQVKHQIDNSTIGLWMITVTFLWSSQATKHKLRLIILSNTVKVNIGNYPN